MNKATLLAKMQSLGACQEATKYVTDHASDSALDIGLECVRANWLIWYLARAGADLRPFSFSCADRAVRTYAPAQLDRAGLHEAAAKLRALAPIDSVESADAAWARAAADAAAAWARARAAAEAYAAWAAARAARAAARAARAAAAAAAWHAADAAAWAARADAAADAAAAARAAEREMQLQALREVWRSAHGG
jgi:hypothetical protein